jgi:hypothetical protein
MRSANDTIDKMKYVNESEKVAAKCLASELIAYGLKANIDTANIINQRNITGGDKTSPPPQLLLAPSSRKGGRRTNTGSQKTPLAGGLTAPIVEV